MDFRWLEVDIAKICKGPCTIIDREPLLELLCIVVELVLWACNPEDDTQWEEASHTQAAFP